MSALVIHAYVGLCPRNTSRPIYAAFKAFCLFCKLKVHCEILGKLKCVLYPMALIVSSSNFRRVFFSFTLSFPLSPCSFTPFLKYARQVHSCPRARTWYSHSQDDLRINTFQVVPLISLGLNSDVAVSILTPQDPFKPVAPFPTLPKPAEGHSCFILLIFPVDQHSHRLIRCTPDPLGVPSLLECKIHKMKLVISSRKVPSTG